MKLKLFIALCLCYVSQLAFANCKTARNELNETKLLFAVGDDLSQLKGWSPDLLTRIVLEIRGPFLSQCPDPNFEKKARTLEKIYLEKLLGFKFEVEEASALFRGLLTLKDDFQRLREKIQKEKIEIRKVEDLKKIYAGAELYEGIALVTESEADLQWFKVFLKEIINASIQPGLLFDSSSLFKILITDHSGVAAFVPEIGILILSKDLVTDLNELKKTVILHELVHVGEVAEWNRNRVKWVKEFATFSGWKLQKGKWQVQVTKTKREAQDSLTTQSQGSPYSILPDDFILRGKDAMRLRDGFVFEKSYRESVARNDVSEDLADAIAAYYVAPQRFCLDKQELAPQKKAWIHKHIFSSVVPSCK